MHDAQSKRASGLEREARTSVLRNLAEVLGEQALLVNELDVAQTVSTELNSLVEAVLSSV